ncbi:MAG: hypothetical protein OH319_02365 [Candidatus Parvarchaeota archaeon]|nr:hypothetical protein [Candidatus Jingweiarchaeum tengchongense]MCW1298212.1 hypothetical protein [Candidatus Jingweiarchaeum tengchongense]MCW1300010.1 hypothetical protein [Candidatus Jingweiarchaeum tengchongense]MCW1305441.1 hypothetical protein [Candidatus Jingweiarchaeum tengchongense]MCW1310451.1 hypothetical protein [Candidatus Jingweiarchaeum tengchongense]
MLCSYVGPDLSEDLLQLSNFSVIGPANPKVGDQLRVEFTLKNQGDESINFTDKGVFAAVRVRYYENKDFGFIFTNKTLSMKDVINFGGNITIDKNGSWKIWPSYEIFLANGSKKQGPYFWHLCNLVICPNYCENSVRYYNGYVSQDGSCGYLQENCSYGCNVEGTECLNVSRIEIIIQPIVYSYQFNEITCKIITIIGWKTNIEGNGTMFYREFGSSQQLNTSTRKIVRTNYTEYIAELALEPNKTYYYYTRTCGPDDCVVSPSQVLTTPNYFEQDMITVNVTTSTANVSWVTTWRGISFLYANYTLYIVPTTYAHFEHPPWSESSNSTFTHRHTATITGLEDGRNYTFYIKSCMACGFCKESERYTLATLERPFPEILNMNVEPYHTNLSLSWRTTQNLNTTVYLIEKVYSNRSYIFWRNITNSSFDVYHSAAFANLSPGVEYAFAIKHCSRIKCGTNIFYFNTTSCFDGMRNGGEYDIDCGGPCEIGCDACNTPILPSRFDWRNWKGKNWLTPVKDQAACGSCWAMATIGAIEAKYKIGQNNANLNPDLSEQYAVSDCGIIGSCNGGNPFHILNYMKNNIGIVDETCFPYQSQRCCWSNGSCTLACTHEGGCANPGDCSNLCSRPQRWKILDFHEITYFVNGALQVDEVKRAIICHGPIIACDCGHCIVLVGWNVGNWIFKNSWGVSWGNGGYGEAPIQGYECSIWEYVAYVESVVRS